MDKEEWFEYVTQFAKNCFYYDPHLYKMVLAEDLGKCSDNIKTKHQNEIVECANDIFSSNSPLNEKLVIDTMKKIEMFSNDILPSIIINGNILKGELTEQNI